MNLKDLLKSEIKNLRYLLEAAAVQFGLWVFYIMGARKAGDVAAKIAIFVGKKISVQKLAYSNLSKALPNLSEPEKAVIMNDMWDNLGRVVGEYSHVAKSSVAEIAQIIEVSGESRNVISDIKKSGKGSIIFSGHMGNWEIGPKVFAVLGIEVHTVYRPLNNPYVEKMTSLMRSVSLIPKGPSGNRRLIEIIKNGGHVLIMADQKISEGEPVKFFHEDAITTTAIARMALKYDVPLVPARAIRIGKNFKFRAEVEKPLEIERTSNINADVLELTAKMNSRLESWITEHPAQWFWVHNRWKK